MYRKDFQYVTMDTDSGYMSLSAPLEKIIRPELCLEYFQNYGSWLPKLFCQQHKDAFIKTRMQSKESKMEKCCEAQLKFDKNSPGLFKTEFVGDGIIALNSKTYFCWGSIGQTKLSSNGLSKTQDDLRKDLECTILKPLIVSSLCH